MKHDKLKNQGQQLHTIKQIHNFIAKNIDQLYTMRPRDITYNPGLQYKNLDQKPVHTLTGRQVNFLAEDK